MNMERRQAFRCFLVPLLNGIVLGAIVGGLMVYVAVQHNPQGEFYDPDLRELVLGSLVFLFASWFLPVALFVFAVESLILLLLRRTGRPTQ